MSNPGRDVTIPMLLALLIILVNGDTLAGLRTKILKKANPA
jgi:hypothetical protein